MVCPEDVLLSGSSVALGVGDGSATSVVGRWSVQRMPRWAVPRMAHSPAHQSRRRPAAATAEAAQGQRFPGKVVAFSSSFTHCVCWAAVGRCVRILAHVGGLPASAPAAAESMTRPVYPPGVFPVRLRRRRRLAVPRGSANGKTMPARGRGPKPHSSGRGVITLRKERCCLRSSTVGRRGQSCPPGYVRRSEDRLSEPRSPRLDHRRSWWTCTAKGCQEQGSAGLE